MYVAVSLFILCLVVFVGCQRFLSKIRRLPPGPIRWPVVGSIPQMMMIDLEYPYRQMMGLAKRYGPITSFGYGEQLTVVVSSYDIMKDLFKRPETNLERYKFQFIEQSQNGKNLGITWAAGDTWRNNRRFTLKTLKRLGFGKTHSMEDVLKEEIECFLGDIRKEISKSGGIWSVDRIRLAMSTLNVVWSFVGGYRFDHEGGIISEYIQLNNDVFEILRSTNPLSAFPFIAYLRGLTSGYRRNASIADRFKCFLRELISDAKLKRKDKTEPESCVDVFLDEIEKSETNPNCQNTDALENQLLFTLWDLFLAGTETTSTLMNWLILYFTINTDVQDKARLEIYNVTNDWTKAISSTESARYPFLRSCIYETMRHSTFGSTPPSRKASSTIECAGYKIPKGTCLLYNLYNVFHDTEFWGDDVNTYNPSRFLRSDQTTIDPRQLERLVQFGFGSRSCPGESLAIETIQAFAIGLLSTFKLGLVNGNEARLEESKPGLTILPKPYVVMISPITN